MIIRQVLTGLGALAMVLAPSAAMAQNITITRSVLPDQSYTLIHPDTMAASGGIDRPLTINHASAPLQCNMSLVPVDDTSWTPETALASLVDADIEAGWSETFPGFALGEKGITAYQSDPALIYEGTSTDSPMGIPLTIVHTETVADGLGYTLDCLFDTSFAAQARPVVDFIIANFSTSAEAECCVGPATPPEPVTPQ